MPIFASVDNARFFQVPMGHKLPDGAFVLKTLMGDRLSVDEAALSPFEIDEATARTRTEAYVAKLKKLTTLLQTLTDQAAFASRLLSQPGTGIDVDNLLGIIGSDRAEAQRDPRSVLKKMWASLKKLPMETVEEVARAAEDEK